MRTVLCGWCGNTYWWFSASPGSHAYPQEFTNAYRPAGLHPDVESICSVCAAWNRHIEGEPDPMLAPGITIGQWFRAGRADMRRQDTVEVGTPKDTAVGALIGLFLGAAGLAYLLSRGDKK